MAKTSTGKVKFFGNGHENKFFKRRFRAVRKKLGQLKNLKAIKKLHDKEQRWMKDKLVEHKLYIRKHGIDLPEIRKWKWGVHK